MDGLYFRSKKKVLPLTEEKLEKIRTCPQFTELQEYFDHLHTDNQSTGETAFQITMARKLQDLPAFLVGHELSSRISSMRATKRREEDEKRRRDELKKSDTP